MQHSAVLHEVPLLHMSAVGMLVNVPWAPTAAGAALTRSALDCLAAADSLDSSLSASDSSNDASFAIHSRDVPGELCPVMLTLPLKHAAAASHAPGYRLCRKGPLLQIRCWASA